MIKNVKVEFIPDKSNLEEGLINFEITYTAVEIQYRIDLTKEDKDETIRETT